jgi:hypothetical protein
MKSAARFLVVIVTITAICRLGAAGDEVVLNFNVAAPKVDCVDVPVCAVIDLPDSLASTPVENIRVTIRQNRAGMMEVYGLPGPGQLVLLGRAKAQLWWIARRLTAGEMSRWGAYLQVVDKSGWQSFSWQDNKGEYLDLLFHARKVTRYMYAYDASSEQRRFETNIPFLHVFDVQGENLLTNGPDGVHPYLKDKILYPHHRGIFIGWSRLNCEGKQYDFWGMGGGAAQVHQKFSELVAGPVLARLTALIHWNDKDGQPIVIEQRQTTVFRQADPTVVLMEFRTELKAVAGDVNLSGDPEHAGFQYRAHNDVAAGGGEVKAAYLFHNDGVDPKKDKDLPWAALVYRLNNRQYCVLHMDHPDNPRPTIYSAYRDYGRFGAFFTHTIKSGEALTLCYRMWIVGGEMPARERCAGKCSAFVDCPQVKVLD